MSSKFKVLNSKLNSRWSCRAQSQRDRASGEASRSKVCSVSQATMQRDPSNSPAGRDRFGMTQLKN